jgi:hypothetical protein
MAKVKKIMIELNADTASYGGCTDDEMESIIGRVEDMVVDRIRSVYPEADYVVGHNYLHGAVTDKIHVVVEPEDDDLVPAQAMMELELDTIEHLQVVIQNANAEVMDW